MSPPDQPSGAPDLLAAALAYAARGWPVFPCNPKTKAPLVKGDLDDAGKAIPKTGGVKKASTDPAVIAAWWKRWPKATIAVAMGREAQVFAVDFDPRTDDDTGEAWTLERLKGEVEAQIGEALPPTATSRTPSGGVHLFFAWPRDVADGAEPIVNRGNLPTHVDVRGDGGYVVVPPSVRDDGVAYRWLRGDDTTPPAEAPAGLLRVLRERKSAPPAERRPAAVPDRLVVGDAADEAKRKYALAALDAEIRALQGTGDGGRNEQLNRTAFALGQLVGAGALNASLARSAIEDVARGWPNLAKSQGTIESGLSSGIAAPRDLSDVAAQAAERTARFGGKPRGSAGHAGAHPPRDSGANAPSSSSLSSSPPAPAPPEGEGKKESSQLGAPAGKPPVKGRGANPDHDRSGAFRPQTDLGNAERWFDRSGDDFRWCAALGWLAWDGRRWNATDAEQRLACSVYDAVRAIGGEADWLAAEGLAWRARFDATAPSYDGAVPGKGDWQDDPDPWVAMPTDPSKWKRKSDSLRGWGRASESSGHLACIAGLAKPWCAVSEGVFDADPLRFNVENGTLRFGRMHAGGIVGIVEMLPHDRGDFITKISPVAYDPAATCPIYDAFLERVQPDPAMRAFLHAWGGYGLTGDVSAQKLVFNYGMGANGKSTWVDTVAFVAGDYGRSVGIETFLDQGTKRKGGDATPDLANLKGVRLVRTSEPERGAKFAEALIKLATGGEPISVRHNYGTFFDLLVQFKLTISGNHRPEIGTDEGIWRRMQLVPWEVTIVEADRDPDLSKKLAGEAAGILNRLLAGVVDWLEAGLPRPDAVVEATQEYRDQSDPLGRFLKLCTEPEPGGRVNSTSFYALWVAWCRSAGEKEWSQKGLAKAMGDRGYRKVKSSDMFWEGLKLAKFETDFIDPLSGKPWPQNNGNEPPDGH